MRSRRLVGPTRYLSSKIMQFVVYYIFLQILPILSSYFISFIFKNVGHTQNLFQLETMLILSGCAWLGIPSFFNTYGKAKGRVKTIRIVSTISGVCLFFMGLLSQSLNQFPSDKLPELNEHIKLIITSYTSHRIVVSVVVAALAFILAVIALIVYYKKSLDKVTLRLLWTHQSQFAGIYVAKEKGFFESRGIGVDIYEGGPGSHPLQFSDPEQTDFAIVSGPDIIRSRKTKTPYKSLAIIIPRSPVCFYSLKESRIQSPADWKGKKIAVPNDYEVEYYVYAILERAGLDKRDVSIQLLSSQEEIQSLFFSKQVDVISGYRTVYPKMNGKFDQLDIINLEECGINTVGDTLAVKDILVSQRRHLVRSFVDAVIEGWQFAIEEANEHETLDCIMKYMPARSDRKFQRQCLLKHIEMIGKNFPSEQNEHTWAEIKEFLLKFKLIDDDVELFTCFAGY